MLKLPKGLKKKKKGKKSKKDQELFTEEELEQYRREHQKKDQDVSEASTSEATESSTHHHQHEETNDDEWSKFKALTGGVDSILKQKQEDLDRIKSTSFFQRVPPPSEKKKAQKKQEEKDKASATAAEEEKQEQIKLAQKEKEEDIFKQAVVELSDSESEEEEADDIFDTTYIDVIAAAEVGLVNVDSPTEEDDDGVDPFDTAYAEKVIKGPEVSKRGKKIVSIGSAVQVLTGRVESVSTATSRRPRRGPKDLLLEVADDAEGAEFEPSPEPLKTLLDDFTEDTSDVHIDLSVSLHLALQKDQKKEESEELKNKSFDLEEFVVLKTSAEPTEDDEFALLAAESLTKEDYHIGKESSGFNQSTAAEGDWAFFEQSKGSKPPRPISGPHIPAAVSDEDLSFREDSSDPFDTAFVERILPATLAEDLDFDPRSDDPIPDIVESQYKVGQFSPTFEETVAHKPDLFEGNSEHLSQLPHNPLQPTTAGTVENALPNDPFDTSVIDSIVAPKATELKLLESELLSNTPQSLKHSLSDPDFDPRAQEEKEQSSAIPQISLAPDVTVQRKSSLVLNFQPSRGVKFCVATPDLLKTDEQSEGHRKPLTPYYTKKSISSSPDKLSSDSDPFDTSFVSESKPTDVELNLLERDLLVESNLKHSLSDPDFNPRADSPKPKQIVSAVKPDLLSATNDFASKVLTPAVESKSFIDEQQHLDPFDTSSIAQNIQPGKAELHLLANEFVPHIEVEEDLFDNSQDTNHFFAGKVLTPQPTGRDDLIEEQDIDPFDTSFASNLAPGPSEIRAIETELIGNK